MSTFVCLVSQATDCNLVYALQDCVQKLKDKLVEAAAVYRKDKETLDWHVMQDPKVSCSSSPWL
jgi:hypothetical protein